MADDEIRVDDWVQLPPSVSVALDRRLGKVIEIRDQLDMVVVRVARVGDVFLPANELRKITWATPYEPPVRPEAGDEGPFCPCGEPVGIWGAACRVCRSEELLHDVQFSLQRLVW